MAPARRAARLRATGAFDLLRPKVRGALRSPRRRTHHQLAILRRHRGRGGRDGDAAQLLALSGIQIPENGRPMACPSKICASNRARSRRNEMMMSPRPTFSLTHDDHLEHNANASVAPRPG